MSFLLRKLASLRLTFAGIAWLALHCVAVSQWPDQMIPWLVLPLALLAVNLLAAILVNRSFRSQSALLLFHIGLFGIVVLAAAQVVLQFDGQVEITEGQHFDPAAVQVQSRGWLHRGDLGDVDFAQGPIEVNYLHGLRRDTTQSTLELAKGQVALVGDRRAWSSQGYRFKATFNKGFSLLLLWQGNDGSEQLGAVNFPSYPEFEWKQRNDWITPAGESISLDLDLEVRVPEDEAWTLASRDVAYDVVLRNANGGTVTLEPGDSVEVEGGLIVVGGLRLWMGYRVDYDPLLPWLLIAAFLTLGALAVHVQRKFWSRLVSQPVAAIGRRAEA
jgi:cytochrome c biogenesis protein